MDGTIEDDVIDGMVSRHDKSQFELRYRLTKRIGLPET